MKIIRTTLSVCKLVVAVCSLLGAALFTPRTAFCQNPNSAILRAKWSAQWISHPTAPLREPGVFHFRKILQLPNRPAHFLVHISADNRFLLFVNGKRVGEGPARGDLAHWRYETFDLAAFLHEGENIIASTVWEFGVYAPLAQISDRVAFLLEGDSANEAVLNTDATWQVEQEAGTNT